jgi:hypothetical protein
MFEGVTDTFILIIFIEKYIESLNWVAKIINILCIFNNISVISWRSVSLVEETGIPRENYRPVTSHWQTLSHNVSQLEPNFAGMMFARSSKTKSSLCLFRKNHGHYGEILVSEWLKLLESFKLPTCHKSLTNFIT